MPCLLILHGQVRALLLGPQRGRAGEALRWLHQSSETVRPWPPSPTAHSSSQLVLSLAETEAEGAMSQKVTRTQAGPLGRSGSLSGPPGLETETKEL